MTNNITISKALISVSDKTNLAPFAKFLVSIGVQIIASGGTYQYLIKHDIPTTELSDYTQFPEILTGRVKTLHPKIHGGILARPEIDETELKAHQIQKIDLVIVNFYPFENYIKNNATTLDEAIEYIDIGGPTLVRAAAKNHHYTAVVTNPNDYNALIEELDQTENKLSLNTRRQLTIKAFNDIAEYDAAIANFFSALKPDTTHSQISLETFPKSLTLHLKKITEPRYGENPQQQSACYQLSTPNKASILQAALIQGKPLSYNNILDLDAAWQCVQSFSDPTCAIIKHNNPCGLASAQNLETAFLNARATDPQAAFGGIIGCNQKLDGATAAAICKHFVEAIIAPAITTEAKTILAAKNNLRVLILPPEKFSQAVSKSSTDMQNWEFKSISGGGLLIQTKDQDESHIAASKQPTLPPAWSLVSRKSPTDEAISCLCFAWKVVQQVKSNAIVCALKQQTIGIGAGQMSRIDSVHLAIQKAQTAGFDLSGAILASDAFFPFPDSIITAAEAGIKAIVQPGGSIRDEAVIAAANEHNMVLIFTHRRHFKH